MTRSLRELYDHVMSSPDEDVRQELAELIDAVSRLTADVKRLAASPPGLPFLTPEQATVLARAWTSTDEPRATVAEEEGEPFAVGTEDDREPDADAEDYGPRWLTAPEGYRLRGGKPIECRYYVYGDGVWSCEVGAGTGSFFAGLGPTQRAAHDNLVAEHLALLRRSDGTLFEPASAGRLTTTPEQVLADGPTQLLDRPWECYGDLLRREGDLGREVLEAVDYAVRHKVLRLLLAGPGKDELGQVYDLLRGLIPVYREVELKEWSFRWRAYADLIDARLQALANRDEERVLELPYVRDILKIVSDHPGLEREEVRRRLGLSVANLSRLLGIMEAHQLIERWNTAPEYIYAVPYPPPPPVDNPKPASYYADLPRYRDGLPHPGNCSDD